MESVKMVIFFYEVDDDDAAESWCCQIFTEFFLHEIREMEYKERAHPLTLFSHLKTNTKSIDIYRVLRCCELQKIKT